MNDDATMAQTLGRLLGEQAGEELEVADLVRLSGGASRETWSFTARGTNGERALVLQRERAGGNVASGGMSSEGLLLRAAADAGVPVPAVVISGAGTDLGASFVVTERVDGETIPRRILRDDTFASARPVLARQAGAALAAVHQIDVERVPALPGEDQVAQFRAILDLLGEPHPAFELGLRWLDENRPDGAAHTVVHGDFRLGNLIVGPEGLRAVLDWELSHLGDPLEDLGWFCVKAWRFGAEPPVAGLGQLDELCDAYEAAGGAPVDRDALHWWMVLGTLRWGIICILQAETHRSGMSRSVELAAIGRRVCETELDLLELLP